MLYFHIQTTIAWFTLEYSKVPSFACFRWLFWRTLSTLKFLNQVRPRFFDWCLFRFKTTYSNFVVTILMMSIIQKYIANNSITFYCLINSWDILIFCYIFCLFGFVLFFRIKCVQVQAFLNCQECRLFTNNHIFTSEGSVVSTFRQSQPLVGQDAIITNNCRL